MTSVHGETGVTREFAGFPRNAASSLESGGRLSNELGRELGVSKHTIYAWKAKYGGVRSEEQTSELQSHSFISYAPFFFNDTATTEIYTLSLHDALPICRLSNELGRELGVSKHTIYAWKAKYGGMSVGEAQRLRQLEDENGRLKKLVADLSLDKEMLKAVIEKNGWSS